MRFVFEIVEIVRSPYAGHSAPEVCLFSRSGGREEPLPRIFWKEGTAEVGRVLIPCCGLQLCSGPEAGVASGVQGERAGPGLSQRLLGEGVVFLVLLSSRDELGTGSRAGVVSSQSTHLEGCKVC